MNKELQELIKWMEKEKAETYQIYVNNQDNPPYANAWQMASTAYNRSIAKARSLCDLVAGASTGEGAEVATD